MANQLMVSGPEGLRPWSQGSATYLVDHRHPSGELVVAVFCRFGDLPADHAMLDTGAAWSILGGLTARLVERVASASLGRLSLSTRLGPFEGDLRRLPVTLVASAGADLLLDATCLVVPDWSGPDVLGYTGCLERLRFALDPGSTPDAETFYFGAVP